LAEYHRLKNPPTFLDFLALFDLTYDDLLGRLSICFFAALTKRLVRRFQQELKRPNFDVLIETRPIPPVRADGKGTFQGTDADLIIFLPVISTNSLRVVKANDTSVSNFAFLAGKEPYEFYAAMNADGLLYLATSPISGGADPRGSVWRLGVDGLELLEKNVIGELMDENFHALFYVKKSIFPHITAHFRDTMKVDIRLDKVRARPDARK
jgi:hypothetical protein